MGAADVRLMPRRAPGWPLAATLGAHLLLAWCWLQAGPRLPETLPGLREFVVVPVFTPAPPPVAAPPAAPPASTRPQRAAVPKPAPVALDAQSQAVLTEPAQAPSAAAPDTDSFAAPPGPAAPSGESSAARALRAAGAVDSALRDGKPARLKAGETPNNRFTAALENAHNDTSRTLSSDSYTTPDGVTIYRFRRGNKVYCRTGGNVRPGIGNLAEGGGMVNFDRLGGEGAAGMIDCPGQAKFKRD